MFCSHSGVWSFLHWHILSTCRIFVTNRKTFRASEKSATIPVLSSEECSTIPLPISWRPKTKQTPAEPGCEAWLLKNLYVEKSQHRVLTGLMPEKTHCFGGPHIFSDGVYFRNRMYEAYFSLSKCGSNVSHGSSWLLTDQSDMQLFVDDWLVWHKVVLQNKWNPEQTL